MADRSQERFLCELRPNDPELRVVHLHAPDYDGVGAALTRVGAALTRTTSVSEMRNLSISNLAFASQSDADKILHFLEECQLLRTVHLIGNAVFSGQEVFIFGRVASRAEMASTLDRTHVSRAEMASIVDRVLFAVGRNANIHELEIEGRLPIRPESMDHILRTTTCMTVLGFEPMDSHTILRAAFAANSTLACLRLNLERSSEAVECILQGLTTLASLRQIELGGYDGSRFHVQFSVMSALVRVLTHNTNLRILCFKNVQFGGNEAKELLKGLYDNQFLDRLELWSASFYTEAADAFVDFTQRKLHTCKGLREMSCRDWYGLSSVQMATLLIGFPLHTLEVDNLHPPSHAFLPEFLRQASLIPLHCLKIRSFPVVVDSTHIVQFLGHATNVREFHVEGSTLPALEDAIWMNAMRQNESLLYVSIPSLSVEVQSRMKSYCQRNRMLPVLLSSPLMKDDDGTATSNEEAKMERGLVPLLFACASGQTRTGPNLILAGLSMLSEAEPKRGQNAA
jgi:hypothetical protein